MNLNESETQTLKLKQPEINKKIVKLIKKDILLVQ